MSILEIAEINVIAGSQPAFEKAVREAEPLFQRADGNRSFSLYHSIEVPTRYRLVIEWDTVEKHTVTFRESEAFLRWRELVGPYFDGSPQVEHHDIVLDA